MGRSPAGGTDLRPAPARLRQDSSRGAKVRRHLLHGELDVRSGDAKTSVGPRVVQRAQLFRGSRSDEGVSLVQGPQPHLLTRNEVDRYCEIETSHVFSTRPEGTLAKIMSVILGSVMKRSIRKALMQDLQDIKRAAEAQPEA